MKAKLGKLKQIDTTQYSGFRSLLKKSVIATLKTPSNNGIINYVMVTGEQLNWKCGGKVTEKPLLFLDENYNSLVKDVKAEKALDLKTYSYGACKVTQVGTDVTVYLCPEKGKLTQPALLKPLKKIFKEFKPKIFFEVVAELGAVEASPSNPDLLEEEGSPSAPAAASVSDSAAAAPDKKAAKMRARAKAIGQNLIKYHQLFQASDKKIKAVDKGDPKRNKLMVQRTKTLKHIKHLCSAWSEEVNPQQDQLKLEANWEKVYAHWSSFFAKRKAAKTGASDEVDARKTEEERLYMKVMEDMERFSEDLEKGKTVDPSIIENDIQALETHLAQWQKFAKGKSAFPEELKAMEGHLAHIKTEWKEEKAKIEVYHKAVQKLDRALETNASEEEVMKLYKEAELLANA